MPLKKEKNEKNPKLPLLLAPAGSMDCMQAALQAGADAVYFGVEQLNMRARSAEGFTLEQLPFIAKHCAALKRRSYLTLNTILYDHDLRLMKRMADAAKDSGIDAIIGSDIALLNYCKKRNIPVHISTQCNITNIESVEFYSAFSDAMVLSRELSIRQVKTIVEEIHSRNICGPSGQPVAIEIFIHGALCMAVSGKCHLSLHSHNASANRGACIQNCRREYTVTDKESGIELDVDGEYIFSANDLCTITFLDKLVETGAGIFKIEGRGRSADYVHTTTACYREALEKIYNGTYTPAQFPEWEKKLSSVFNRGFWEGYYMGKLTGEWSKTGESLATQKKIYVGKGRKYFSDLGVGEFLMESHDLKEGDSIMIIGPTTGYMESTVLNLHVNGRPARSASKNDEVTLKVPARIRPSDKLYKVVPVV